MLHDSLTKIPTVETWDLPWRKGDPVSKKREDFRFIPRSKRREMARELAKRTAEAFGETNGR